MDELTLKVFSNGPLLTNCYLIFRQDTKQGFLVDSPWESKEVIEFIKNQNIEINFILLTHAHFDHIHGLDDFDKPFYVHQEDLPLLTSLDLNGSSFFGSAVSTDKKARVYSKEGFLDFSGQRIEVIHTPGHTPGSVCLRLGNWLFSGDTLFFNSVGRADIPLGSEERLLKAIRDKLMILPLDTAVYPGHGQPTTIGREKKHNPFI